MTSNSEVETAAIDSHATETITTQTEYITTASIATQTHCISPVTNTVLGYMQYGFDSGSADRLHTLALATFSAEEIFAAPHVLYDEYFLGSHNLSTTLWHVPDPLPLSLKRCSNMKTRYPISSCTLLVSPVGRSSKWKTCLRLLWLTKLGNSKYRWPVFMMTYNIILRTSLKSGKHLINTYIVSGYSTNSSATSAVPISLVTVFAFTVSSKVSPKRHPGIHSNSASLKPFVSYRLFSTSFLPPSLTPSGVKFGVLSKESSPIIVDPDPKQPNTRHDRRTYP